MHKKLLLCALSLLICVPAFTAGRWTFFGAYHNSLQNIPVGDVVFTLCDGCLFSYSPSDEEVRTYDKPSGLSDADISQIAYSEAENCLVIVYSNSDIDLLFPDKSGVVNMPQFMNSSLSDKTINDVTVSGSEAVIATNTGVTLVDLERTEFSATYTLSVVVNSAAIVGDKLVAATASGIMVGDRSNNLRDPSNWEIVNEGKFTKLRALGSSLYGCSSTVYSISLSDGSISRINNSRPTFMSADNSSFLFYGNSSEVYSISTDGTVSKICGSNNFNYLSYSDGTYWASCGFSGTTPYKIGSDGMLQSSGNGITLNSPLRNYCAFLKYTPSWKLLVAGGTLNYNRLVYPGTVYTYENGQFLNFEDSLGKYTGLSYNDMTGVAEDPSDPTHHFATSGGTGLYEFRDGKYVNHYDDTNTPLESAVPSSTDHSEYVRTGALQYDASGNLWMLNDEVDTVVKILKQNGEWASIYIDQLDQYPTFDRLIFDNDGRAWFTHRRTTSVHRAGIACLDVNGTIDDTSDDSFTFRYNFTNEDGTTYNPTSVDAVAMDKNGSIWVGTVEGPFLIDDPSSFSNGGFTFTQVKVPRNDGTDYADYLLTGVPISSIAVDAANRKWFGTKGDGVYLISADNIETIEHFTSSNSPLVSDNVLDVAVNENTGDVMIATDKGLMCYNAGKTSSGNSLKDKDLRIYPNPVRPDYYGNVTIEGLPSGAEVKIVTTGGQLVRKSKTTSGKYEWDVKDANGNGVGSGVYYVLAVTSDGKHGARGRIVVIR